MKNMNFVDEWNVIGLMSGTSLDGVDIIYTQISKNCENYSFQIIASETIPYEKKWEVSLRNLFFSSKDEIEILNIEYGIYLGDLVNKFRDKYKINHIDFVSSHGHTIFHKPNEGYTLQIGDGQSICKKTNLKVVCDFRTQDVAFGGQGAPLVPIGDKLLFSNFKYCLNLGGFANISYEENIERIAFDICPVNIVLNYYSKKMGFDYDNEGKIASKGRINELLLNKLNAISFYGNKKPKSLGFEFVKEIIFPLIDSYKLSVEDVLRTFIAHIVFQIARILDGKGESELLITGGGVFNTFLINELKNATRNKIIIPDSNTINYKEALIFALLGVLRVENQVNCLRSVTGATKDHCSGKIFQIKE
jgi:anhydro-N-acetylmuramic acid kinase